MTIRPFLSTSRTISRTEPFRRLGVCLPFEGEEYSPEVGYTLEVVGSTAEVETVKISSCPVHKW